MSLKTHSGPSLKVNDRTGYSQINSTLKQFCYSSHNLSNLINLILKNTFSGIFPNPKIQQNWGTWLFAQSRATMELKPYGAMYIKLSLGIRVENTD